MTADGASPESAFPGVEMLGARRRAVVFDADDTLWLTEGLYDAARAAAKAVVESAGFDGDCWEERQRLNDVDNVARLGHSPLRFPTSCVEALDHVGGEAVTAAERTAVWDAAASVFDAVAPLRQGADRVLTDLRSRGLRLVLLTKGDADLQQRRVADSGLANHFDHVEIVASKSAHDFRRVVNMLGLSPSEVISVGNSIRFDIRPSVEAGVDAIWIPAHVWEYERDHADRVDNSVARIERLADLLAFLPQQESANSES